MTCEDLEGAFQEKLHSYNIYVYNDMLNHLHYLSGINTELNNLMVDILDIFIIKTKKAFCRPTISDRLWLDISRIIDTNHNINKTFTTPSRSYHWILFGLDSEHYLQDLEVTFQEKKEYGYARTL